MPPAISVFDEDEEFRMSQAPVSNELNRSKTDDRVADLAEARRAVVRELVRLETDYRSAVARPSGLWTLLGPTPLGSVATIYSDEAIAGWRNWLDREPEDDEARHHLTVMLHARAIDLEQGASPRASNPDWEAALHQWSLLWRSDTFWERLRQFLPKSASERVVRELRERWPLTLQRLHADIACDPETRQHRREYHIRLLHQAPFSEEIKQQLLREIYERYLHDVPATVWRDDMLEVAQIQSAIDIIEQFLEFDPQSVMALTDVARLQTRLLNRWLAELGALPRHDQTGRQRACERFVQLSDAWRPRFDLLAGRMMHLELSLRGQLAEWFSILGQAAYLLDRYQLAEECHLLAERLSPDPGDQLRCRRHLWQTRTEMVWEKARDGHRDALPACRALIGTVGTSHECCYRLADALKNLGDFEHAFEVAERGRQLVDPSVWPDGDEHTRARFRLLLDELRSEREELGPMIHEFGGLEIWQDVRAARVAYQDRRHGVAFQRLRDAIGLCPGAERLKTELSLMLNNAALALFEERTSRDLSDAEEQQIHDWFVEAARLTPQDPVVLANLEHVAETMLERTR